MTSGRVVLAFFLEPTIRGMQVGDSGPEHSARNALDLPQQIVQAVFANLFSVGLLALFSVVTSGKILSRRLRLGFSERDKVVVDVRFIAFRATGDEFYLGLISFLVMLMPTVAFGGSHISNYLMERTGLKIAVYSAECIAASLLSLMTAIIFGISMAVMRPVPIVSETDRNKQIAILTAQDGEVK